MRSERIHDALKRGSNLLFFHRHLCWQLLARQEEEMPHFGGREPERLCQAIQHLPRGVNIVLLLKQGVPGDPDACQLRHLFAPQSWGATATG